MGNWIFIDGRWVNFSTIGQVWTTNQSFSEEGPWEIWAESPGKDGEVFKLFEEAFDTHEAAQEFLDELIVQNELSLKIMKKNEKELKKVGKT